MNKYQSSSYQVNRAIESMQLITVPSPVENPSAWMHDGTSPTEIILATAVVIVAVSSVIGSVACLAQVLVGTRKIK